MKMKSTLPRFECTPPYLIQSGLHVQGLVSVSTRVATTSKINESDHTAASSYLLRQPFEVSRQSESYLRSSVRDSMDAACVHMAPCRKTFPSEESFLYWYEIFVSLSIHIALQIETPESLYSHSFTR